MHFAIESLPLMIVHSTSSEPLVVPHECFNQPFHMGIYYVNTEYVQLI